MFSFNSPIRAEQINFVASTAFDVTYLVYIYPIAYCPRAGIRDWEVFRCYIQTKDVHVSTKSCSLNTFQNMDHYVKISS